MKDDEEKEKEAIENFKKDRYSVLKPKDEYENENLEEDKREATSKKRYEEKLKREAEN